MADEADAGTKPEENTQESAHEAAMNELAEFDHFQEPDAPATEDAPTTEGATAPVKPEATPAKPATKPTTEQVKVPVKEPEPAAPLPQPVSLPRGLVRKALAFGATQEQINSLDPAKALDILDRYVEDKELERERQVKEPAKPKEEDEAEKLLAELDADHPLSKLHRLTLARLKRIDEVESRLKASESRQESERFTAQDQAIDKVFAEINFANAGTKPALESKPEEMAFRVRVMRAAGVDLSKDSPSVIAKKLHAVKGDYAPATPSQAEPKKEPEKKPAQKSTNGKRITEEQWDKAGIAAPTNVEVEEKPGDRKAMKAIAEWQRTHADEIHPNRDQYDAED